ncbi:nucleotide sugar dehydrogenase (plasmid) [Hoeflea sp. IMCC20628]|uniref:UDP-glucose dehydrogenase family protein n=1 Tax=Hoeflea sp. IMCC20628 TaxID=1620421 RepID=UPI00063AD594|nr:UDP-glucose/GDP-mannose dehydrogenase family protein [Hoeflea sp. IMCC20628]AKI03381.1 nucleotide sugar dehydrogenase [Hoeflea sp. IMCC20628]
MKVTVFGTGYVGLVQAAVFADVGFDVVCFDIDSRKIEALNEGKIPIYEPGLENLVQRNAGENRLRFRTDVKMAVDHGDIQIIAVGTPTNASGGADLRNVEMAISAVAEHMTDDKLVVIKSTVPVGTGDAIEENMSVRLNARGSDKCKVIVVSNPEFLKQGSAVNDCMRPDRIIIGTNDPEANLMMRKLYAPFNRNHEKFIVMDRRSAELTKYAANCMLATKISFINEIAALADALGADIEHIRKGIGSDPRIGYDFIYPGVGYGGSCFPKDVKALAHTAMGVGVEPWLLNAVEKRNLRQRYALFDKIDAFFGGELQGKVFAFWGLAFKPNTNDMREAPARALMERLWEVGATVHAYDPEAMDECRRIYGNHAQLVMATTKEDALAGADALVVNTEWKAFQAPDFDLISRSLKAQVVFDGRNIYDLNTVRGHGLTYFGIGRSSNTVVHGTE